MSRRKRMMEELERDIREHIARETQENIDRGMSPDEARFAALRKFGNMRRVKEDTRGIWTLVWLEQLWQDVRYALRMLRKSPGFTAVAVLTLALGIGANTAMFSVTNAVLLRMLPVRDPQQLVLLDWTAPGWPDGSVLSGLAGSWDKDESGRLISTSFSYPTFEQIQARNHVFSSVASLAGNGSGLNVSYNGQPRRADGELVSGTFFSTLGVQPILGRALVEEDDRIEASPAAVISYGYWQQRFAGDAKIVGRRISVNSVPFTIVGVCPRGFDGVETGRSVDVWLPMHTQPQVEPRWTPTAKSSDKRTHQPQASLFDVRDGWWVVIVGRLLPGTSEQQARAALEVIFQQSIAAGAASGSGGDASSKPGNTPHLEVQPGGKGLEGVRGTLLKPLYILMTVVGLVLLIACINVANLLLARGTSRHREVAVRLAVGANRSRIVRQLVTESVLLALVGGIAGLLFAFWGTDALIALMGGGADSIRLNVSPDPHVLAFTGAISVLAGILFGLSPALRSTRVELTPALKEATGESLLVSTGHRVFPLQLGGALVVAQVSLSLLLLVGAGLFARTLLNLERVNVGFDARDLLLFGIDPTQAGYRDQRLVEFYQELTRRIEALPGVRSVSLSHSTLVGGGGNFQTISKIPGYVPKPAEQVGAAIDWIGPNFFETMGIHVLLGRTNNEGDTQTSPKVMVVNEQFVRQFLGSTNPIGVRIGRGDSDNNETEIVGVVPDSKVFKLREDDLAAMYVPWLQNMDVNGPMNFEVRTAGDPAGLVNAVRRAAQGMNSNIALYDVKTEAEQIDQSLSQERLFARLTSFFGALAAILACVGLYGVMAFAVSRRTREIGIRVALGASRAGIVKMVLRDACALLGMGVALGIAAALGASRLISSMLFGVTAGDPYTYAIVAIALAAAALAACWIPARRAMRVDPMVALRYE